MLMVILAGAIAAIVSGAGAFGADTPAKNAKKLFAERCSVCHGLDRATDLRKTPEDWARTVNRMRVAYGAKLTDEEATIISGYLSKHHGAR